MSTKTIRSLIVKVGADLSDMEKGFKNAEKDFKKVGKQLSSVGATMTNNVTVPVVAAISAIGGLAIKASKTADDILTMSKQLSVSTDTLQKFKYATAFVDVELGDMAKGLSRVVMAMGEASKSGEDFISVGAGLTVSARDASGMLKDSETVFYEVIDAIGRLSSETEKEIASQDIFGKSYQNLMPLIDGGSAALKKFGDEAVNVGAVIDGQTLGSLGELNDKYEKVKAAMEAAGTKIGAAFLPAIEALLPVIDEKLIPAIASIAEGVGKAVDWFMALDPETQKLIGALGLIAIAAGPVISAIGGISTAVSGVMAGAALLTNPAGWVILGLAALAAAVMMIATNWDTVRWRTIDAANQIIAALNLIPFVDIERMSFRAEHQTEFDNGRTGGGGGASIDNRFKPEGSTYSRTQSAAEEKLKPHLSSTTINFTPYASGGHPSSGEIFTADENNIYEFKGTAGGRPTVANNSLMEAAVAVGNREVVAAIDRLAERIGKQSGDMFIDGDRVTRRLSGPMSRYENISGPSLVR